MLIKKQTTDNMGRNSFLPSFNSYNLSAPQKSACVHIQ